MLTPTQLLPLEIYAKQRNDFRAQVIAHKKHRTLSLGEHVVFIFEDDLSIRYQIQEMLRIEKIFEEAQIQEELDAYNPLIPTGSNLKATMMIEYENPIERQESLTKLKGIEHTVWMRVEGYENIKAIADEDIPRENTQKTSAVHFLRFEFSKEMIQALKAGKNLSIGINHPLYPVHITPIPEDNRQALIKDFR